MLFRVRCVLSRVIPPLVIARTQTMRNMVPVWSYDVLEAPIS